MVLSFDTVYGWLNYFDDGSYLDASLARIVQSMKSALENKDIPALTRYIRWLQHVRRSFSNPLVLAESYLECGWVYYKMGDYTRALAEFQLAGNLYRSAHTHNTGVTWWLLGCTEWHLSRPSRAITHWGKSKRIFMAAARENLHSPWYQERVQEMQITLDRAIDQGRWPFDN